MTLADSIALLKLLIARGDEWQGRYRIELDAYLDVWSKRVGNERVGKRYRGRNRAIYEQAYREACEKRELGG